MIFSLVLAVVLVSFCFGVNTASAATSCEGVSTSSIECGDKTSGIGYILGRILTVMSISVGVLGVTGVAWAGVQYLTAKDNEEQVRRAKRRIYEIVIGLAVYALGATILPWIYPNWTNSPNIPHYDIPDIPVSPSGNNTDDDQPKPLKKWFGSKSYKQPHGLAFNYTLSVPKGATTGLPLVVFMHGDNTGGHSFYTGWMSEAYKRGKKVISIAPYVPMNDYIPSSIFMSSLNGLIKSMIKKFGVDKGKVYVLGFSRGAYLAGGMARAYTKTVAGVGIMGCSAGVPSPESFKKKTAYFAAAFGDNVCGGTRGMYSLAGRYSAAGAKTKVDTFPGGHGDSLGRINIDKVLKFLGCF